MEAACQHRGKIDPETGNSLIIILELLDPAMPEAA